MATATTGAPLAGVSIRLRDKLREFQDTWSPKVIAGLNDYRVKLAKLDGEFVWHDHPDTDELFLCVEGEFEMHYRDRVERVTEGELVVVPRGVEHKPVARDYCAVLLIEPAGLVNTGDAGGDLTAPVDEWL
ncbi:MAG: cupin domain-containing protein [Pseudomonadota bacterium]